MKTKIRMAIYSRKSKYSENGDSVGNQIELAIEYIRMHYPESQYDVETVVYEDEGFSGGNIDRPRFKAFLHDEAKNPFNILICYRLDRISRNIADFSNLMNEITKLGTSFISIKEQFDTTTPMGRAMMYIASVFAQLEREVIAERIRDNMIELAKTGRWLGGDAPTGYKSERYEIVHIDEQNESNIIERRARKACKLITDEEEKGKLILICRKYREIKSLSGLEMYCLKNNIRSRNGKEFITTTLRMLLTNPVYVKNDEDARNWFMERGIQIYAEGEQAKFDGKFGIMAYNKSDGAKKREMKDWIVAVRFT